MGSDLTVDGIDYITIELVWGTHWICYRVDDPEKILRFVAVPA